MTPAELRDLLAEVEKHGGPKLQDHIEGNNMCWTLDEGWAIAVGVLKRDLIERGAYEVYSGLSTSDYVKGVNTTVGGVAKVEFGWADPFFGEGDTELEAVLRAWLAAAKAEGWTP